MHQMRPLNLRRWALMPRLRHERPGMTYACPVCDRGGGIYERTGNGNATDHPERPYRCNKCETAIHYVIERPKDNTGGSRNAQQRTLTSHYGVNAHRIRAKAESGDINVRPVRGGAD